MRSCVNERCIAFICSSSSCRFCAIHDILNALTVLRSHQHSLLIRMCWRGNSYVIFFVVKRYRVIPSTPHITVLFTLLALSKESYVATVSSKESYVVRMSSKESHVVTVSSNDSYVATVSSNKESYVVPILSKKYYVATVSSKESHVVSMPSKESHAVTVLSASARRYDRRPWLEGS